MCASVRRHRQNVYGDRQRLLPFESTIATARCFYPVREKVDCSYETFCSRNMAVQMEQKQKTPHPSWTLQSLETRHSRLYWKRSPSNDASLPVTPSHSHLVTNTDEDQVDKQRRCCRNAKFSQGERRPKEGIASTFISAC
eukprot:m.8225 g.8225  ORF g.8225 m.8225 type:complete len:140 (+) comp20430_c0_seq1:2-421(+)